ncbi:MAG: helix-turn-helix domain-containing protein [Firmicutes bacterium]|nr:helix-turn-helix domain-containing protein [Bacillota bacterium]MBQ4093157.1 helix-turn-helix domain-containing protein [Bacillota bacterium]
MLSENLLNLRKLHGFSQEYVAEKIGVSRQAVAKWENGTTTPDIMNCAALAKLYNVTLDELITFDDHEIEGLTVPPKGKYMFGTVKVGEKGQIVIPVKARRIFHLDPGTELLMLGDIEQGLALVRVDHFLGIIEELKKGEGK